MPQAADDQPKQEAGETGAQEQPATPADGAMPAPQETSGEAGANIGAAEGAPSAAAPRRRRRRRRRKGPRPADGAPVSAEGQTPVGDTTAEPGQTAVASPAAIPPPNPQGPRDRGPGERRFRDRRPRPAVPGEAGAGPQTPRPPGSGPRAPGERRFRDRRPRHGTPAAEGAPAPGAAEPRAPEQGRREPGPRDAHPRGDRRRDERPRGPKKGKFGDRRDAPFKKPEPKLYSLESVVDRGFEEVADTANEGETKRVDWTILKRTVADQRSAKPVSAIYLLRRDGVDAEFGNLSAARLAVNKTIVHPEKLTKAKGDYGAGGKKK